MKVEEKPLRLDVGAAEEVTRQNTTVAQRILA